MSQSIAVFVCSTYSDLVDERRATIDSIGRLKLQHESMEFFGARSGRPLETCLAEVRKSSILVVIVGHKYGSLVPGDSISFCEAEYREGQRLKKTCLIYMRDDAVAVPATSFESDPAKLQALLEFKLTLSERHTVARFRTPENLAKRVEADLLASIELLEAEDRWRQEAAAGTLLSESALLKERRRRELADLLPQDAGRALEEAVDRLKGQAADAKRDAAFRRWAIALVLAAAILGLGVWYLASLE